MKMYLSSYRIPSLAAFEHFVGKPAAQTSVGLILNAKDATVPGVREVKVQEALDYFLERHFKAQEINLLSYHHVETLLADLKNFDVVWFCGGDIVSLRRAVAQSRLDKVISQLLDEGIIYGGDSAGAILAGPTLRHFDAPDDPTTPQAIVDGLGLVSFAVVPHWGMEGWHDLVVSIKQKLDADGYETVCLTDNEFLLIEDGKILQ